MAQAVEPAIEHLLGSKVVGVGGAGGAAINRMVAAGIEACNNCYQHRRPGAS